MSTTEEEERPTSTQHPKADIRWLWRLMIRHRTATIGSIVFSMLAGITAAAQPYLVGIIIDHVRDRVGIEQIVLDGVLLVILGIFTVAAFYMMRYYSGNVAFIVNYDMRKELFDNLLTLDQSFFHQYPTGDIISRLNSDVDMVRRLLLIGLSRGGSAILTLLIAFVLLATVNLNLTIVVFIVLAISTTFQLRAGMVLAPVFEKVQDQAGVLSALVQDSVSGIQTIKTTGTEEGVASHYYQENMEYRRRWLYFRRRNEPVGMLPNMISELTAGIVVVVGGVMAVNGNLTIGNFAQFLIYLGLIGNALLHIGTVYQRYQQVLGALQRITPLLQYTKISSPINAKPLPMPHGDIEFQDVGVKIDDNWLLRDISLKIKAGSVVAFVGPTGCGKTLLVNLIARVLDPDEGCVLVDGTDVKEMDLAMLREACAYVPQSTFLFSQSLHQNVRMGIDNIHEDEIDRSIRISRVSNDLKQLPNGLDTMVGEKGVMLSGGQKQRVAIARAIIRDPAIMILDDALSSVDTHTAAEILGELRDVVRTRTSLLIAHRIATVKDADHIVVMEGGRIVEQGTHDTLLAQNGAYTRMVERELREEDRSYER